MINENLAAYSKFTNNLNVWPRKCELLIYEGGVYYVPIRTIYTYVADDRLYFPCDTRIQGVKKIFQFTSKMLLNAIAIWHQYVKY